MNDLSKLNEIPELNEILTKYRVFLHYSILSFTIREIYNYPVFSDTTKLKSLEALAILDDIFPFKLNIEFHLLFIAIIQQEEDTVNEILIINDELIECLINLNLDEEIKNIFLTQLKINKLEKENYILKVKKELNEIELKGERNED